MSLIVRITVAAALFSLIACSPESETTTGAPAVWKLNRDQRLDDSSTSFTALVTRLNCNGGRTGRVMKPDIRLTDTQVIVTFRVQPDDPEAADCPTNNTVPVEVVLPEPLKGRKLKDGQCLPGEAATGTTFCDSP